jgi:tetratricopeptide (TPR) repeat protein
MHVESVAWITERKDVLSTFFLLLTLAAYAGYVKRLSVFKYIISLILFALGLMAKPMLVTLPFVLLLLDYWPLNRFEVLQPAKKSDRQLYKSRSFSGKPLSPYYLFIEKIPFLALAAVSSTVTFIVQRRGGAVADVGVFSFESRFANALLSYVRYIGTMFWPIDLAVLYPFEMAVNIPFWQSTLCILLLTGITLAVLCLGHSRKYLPVGWFWFLGTLLPVIGLVHVGPQAYADRYTYIPYIGLFLMIAWGLPEFLSKLPYRRAVLGAAMALVLTAMGLCAYRQTCFWKDSITLFSHAIEVTKNNYIMHVSLGFSYDVLGRREEAIKAYQQSIRIDPNYPKAYYNLGITYGKLGHYQEAIEANQQVIRIDPDYAKAYNNLGAAYSKLGRWQEAIDSARRACELTHHRDAAFLSTLAMAYWSAGKNQEAVQTAEAILKIDPDVANAHGILGSVLSSEGSFKKAVFHLKRLLEIEPNNIIIKNNLAWIFAANPDPTIRNSSEAIRLAQEACTSTREMDPFFFDTLAAAYACGGRFTEAVETAQKAIGLAEAANQIETKTAIERRLNLYKQNQPYIELVNEDVNAVKKP